MGRRSLVGSMIGGIKETQEMLDFCAQHEPPIASDVDVISAAEANHAMVQLASGRGAEGARRFVIDVGNTLHARTHVEDDDAIDPMTWQVRARVHPPTANIHNKQSHRNETI